MKKPKRVIVIGASAGGIGALDKVVSSLPATLPAAVILVQHLMPGHKTKLHEYLSRRSPMRVCLAEEGMPLEEGTVYVSLPGKHLIIKNGRLILTGGKPVHHIWPSADLLFTSAAREYGSRVIGVVLTGTGKDGADGCREIKEKGGITISQDKTTSHSFGMPGAAIGAGVIDYILPIDKIPAKIIDLAGRKRR